MMSSGSGLSDDAPAAAAGGGGGSAGGGEGGGGGSSSSGLPAVVIDLESSVASRYRGEALLQRLLWITSTADAGHDDENHHHQATSTHHHHHQDNHRPSAAVVQQAYELAARCMRETGNAARYKQVFGGNVDHNHNNNNRNNSDETQMSQQHQQQNQQQQQQRRQQYHGIPYDAHWVQETDISNRTNRDVLCSRLQSAQSHLNKEAIRTAYLALAEHDLRTGNVQAAFSSVIRAKDYCTNRPQTTSVSLFIVEISLYLKNYGSVKDYCTKLEHTLGSGGSGSGSATAAAGGNNSNNTGGAAGAASQAADQTSALIRYKVQTASALEALATGDYNKAAQKFMAAAKNTAACGSSAGGANAAGGAGAAAVGGGNGAGDQQQQGNNKQLQQAGGNSLHHHLRHDAWDEYVLAPEEIALYAAFLCLSCCGRKEMVSLAEHADALELVPAARECLLQFGRRAQYAEAYAILRSLLLPVLRLDLYVAPHVSALLRLLTEKCIVHYWQPYQRVEWSVMHAELGRTGMISSREAMVHTVVDLIARGKLPDTRLDTRAGTLIRDGGVGGDEDGGDDKENDAAATLARLTRTVLDDTYGMVVRLACAEHDVRVQDPAANKRGLRGAGRGGGGGVHGGGVMDFIMDHATGPESSEEEMDTPMVDAAIVGDGMNPEDLY